MVLRRTVLVTGAGRGIGEAVALAFAAEGSSLVITSRTQSDLERVAAKIRSLGAEAEIAVGDVSKPTDAERVTQLALERFGGVDVLVNNAGAYGPIGPFAETDLAEWWHAMEVNLRGALLFTKAVLPVMIKNRRGKIINMSGGGATSPLPNLTAYSVSKTAIVRLTENLAEELQPYNIQVNAIAPGAVDTHLQDQLLAAGERAGKQLYDRIRQLRETGKGGVPPTVAAALAVFLGSAGSDHLTGRLISAPHDPWREWSNNHDSTPPLPMYTLRRLDPFTLKPLKDHL
jgi:NAD(P)-dependent dehydrogenase (short-subunit alcohol dehydrogenase family)